MESRTDLLLARSIDGVVLYQRLFLAWASIFAIAMLFCLLKSLVDQDYLFRPGETIKWTATRWGAWPILLPVCMYLFRAFARHLSLVAGVVATLTLAIVGTSLFAYFVGMAFGVEWSLSSVIYHMLPISAGTYLTFGMVVLLLFFPSNSKEAIEEDPPKDGSIVLEVWDGQFRTWIDAALIEWVRAARNYVELHVGDKSYLMRISMNDLEQLLPRGQFLRTHRSYIVNLKSVDGLGGSYARPEFVLKAGIKLPIGKSYKDASIATIKQNSAFA